MSLPTANLKRVKEFWEDNPFFSLKTTKVPGSKEFFDEQDFIYSKVVLPFTAHLYRFNDFSGKRVLDVGCGPGWSVRNYARGKADVYGVDLARSAVKLAIKSLEIYGLEANIIHGDAENLPFKESYFDFVSSYGVLHHTPNTERAVKEIYRVLKRGGEACISLYYRNPVLYLFPVFCFFLKVIPIKVPKRMLRATNVTDFARLLDGEDNPLGKIYSKKDCKRLFTLFELRRMEVHQFPLDYFPFLRRAPFLIHRLLDRYCGIMMYVQLKKVRRLS